MYTAAKSTFVAQAPVAARRAQPAPRRAAVVVRADGDAKINPDIQKDSEKVATMIKCSEMGKKGVFCRCWRSKTFPMCDGAHVEFNKKTGDNVGPLIVTDDT
ncbi:unnamed protein product [Pedinophyceae sp. YPF-701]|nr:unnamed protein product [Pedinophyceae sp. YPF-701]